MHWQTKKILDDIIDVAYSEESEQRRKFFKWFTIELEVKNNNSYNGTYDQSKKRIRIVNLNHSTEAIVKTCIHELAHHIDYCKHGKTGHQEPFYKEYQTLLYAALNMRIFDKEHLFDERVSTDYYKVKKIVDAWVPNYVEYKQNKITIKAIVPFDKKDIAKSAGYHWNSVEKTWEKEIEDNYKKQEERFLCSIGCTDITVNDAANFDLTAIGYLVTNGDSYVWKEVLKENGFFYRDKHWYKKIVATLFEEERASILPLTPGLDYKMVPKLGPQKKRVLKA